MSRKMMLSDKLFDLFNYLFLACIFVVTFYPFWNILVISLNDATDAVRGGLYLWPRMFTLESYDTIFRNSELINSVKVTVLRTLIGLLCPSSPSA